MLDMIAETSFMNKCIDGKKPYPIQLLKNEAIDRLEPIVDDLPKYKKNLEDLMVNFKIDQMMGLINTIYRDKEFKSSKYYRRYSEYFDEIEDMTHNSTFVKVPQNTSFENGCDKPSTFEKVPQTQHFWKGVRRGRQENVNVL